MLRGFHTIQKVFWISKTVDTFESFRQKEESRKEKSHSLNKTEDDDESNFLMNFNELQFIQVMNMVAQRTTLVESNSDSVGDIQFTSASRLISFLFCNPDELCNRLRKILQEKQNGKDTNNIDDETVAIFDYLPEYTCSTETQL